MANVEKAIEQLISCEDAGLPTPSPNSTREKAGYDPIKESIDFIPLIFFKYTLNSENKYGCVTHCIEVNKTMGILYFDQFGGNIPEPLVIIYRDNSDWELITLSRFMKREFGKED